MTVLGALLLFASRAMLAADAEAPESVLELLPPGIRPPEERAALAWRSDAAEAPHFVEVVEAADARDASRSWLEIQYTVDPGLDERVRGVLEREGVPLGHVILMSPEDGEVFSYVSTDPVVFPATRTYPTASLMKVVTAAAVLRNQPGAVQGGCRYVGSPYALLSGQLDAPERGGRVDSFWRAIAISNNQCFGRLAVHQVGEEALLAEMSLTGLLDAPALRHSAGLVEPVEDELDLGELGSGLAGSFITPLGAARLAALLADGELVQPFWISRVRDARGEPLALPSREEPRRAWTPEIAAQLREILVGVTEQGTARRAFLNEAGEPVLGSISVSGKTGTLSGTDPAGRYQWFIGVAPAEAPTLAIATVVVNDPAGGRSASHVAAATLREVFCEAERCEPERVAVLRDRATRRRAQIARDAARVAAEPVVLDRPPRPIGFVGFDFPRRLTRRKASGEVVLLVSLDRQGGVLGVEVDASDLPDFETFLVEKVRSWRFTPPTRQGRPVEAQARLPIPIQID